MQTCDSPSIPASTHCIGSGHEPGVPISHGRKHWLAMHANAGSPGMPGQSLAHVGLHASAIIGMSKTQTAGVSQPATQGP